MKSKRENEIFHHNIQILLPEVGIFEKDVISFFNRKKQSIDTHLIDQKSAFKLTPNAYFPDDPSYYRSFNLLLTDGDTSKKFNHMDEFKFESIAVKNNKFKLKIPVKPIEKKVNKDEMPWLISFHEKAFSAELSSKNLNITEYSWNEKKLITVSDTKTLDQSNFLKVSPSKYIFWKRLSNSSDVSVNFYGDFVEEAELSGVVEANRNYYVLLIFKDRVSLYPAWKRFGKYD